MILDSLEEDEEDEDDLEEEVAATAEADNFLGAVEEVCPIFSRI